MSEDQAGGGVTEAQREQLRGLFERLGPSDVERLLALLETDDGEAGEASQPETDAERRERLGLRPRRGSPFGRGHGGGVVMSSKGGGYGE